MFFPRLRRQAKWMFVFLALVFGLGYVIFNVGGTIPGTGIADLLRGPAAATGQPSVSGAREQIEENPRNPDGYRNLAQALQAEGRSAEAIPPLERYVRMRPRDAEALQELAALYTVETDRLRDEYQLAQYELLLASSGSIFSPTARLGDGQAPRQDPITEALSTRANERASALGVELQTVSSKATRTYQKVARLNPEDANVQIQLAQAAESAGNVPVAIRAYQRFLKLAPDDTSAPLIRDRIKQLRSAGAGTAAG